MTSTQARARPTRSPLTIDGSADGKTTSQSIACFGVPSICAERMSTFGVRAAPAAAFSAIGKNAPRAISEIEAAGWIPKKTTANGTHAVIGIGRSRSISGCSSIRGTMNQPVARPTTTPTTAAMAKPVRTRNALEAAAVSQVPVYGVVGPPPKIQTYQAVSTVCGAGTSDALTQPTWTATSQRTTTASGMTRYCQGSPRRTGSASRAGGSAPASPACSRTPAISLLRLEVRRRLASAPGQERVVDPLGHLRAEVLEQPRPGEELDDLRRASLVDAHVGLAGRNRRPRHLGREPRLRDERLLE